MKLNFINKNRNIKEITEEEMKEIIRNIQEAVILDVRSVQEYNEGHIYGAINIPVYDLEQKARNMLRNKDAVIIAYCSAGIRSRKAIKILMKLGYKNLYNVQEGVSI